MRAVRLLPVFALAACGGGGEPIASSARPVIGGERTSGDPAVVSVFLQTPSGALAGMCSGSLISPRVVMTAAHCADAASGAARWEIYFGALSTGGDINFIDQVPVIAHVVHPRWKNADLGAGNDIALLLMARPAAGAVAPIAINHTALGPGQLGEPVRLVGFGNLVADIGAGQKRTGTTSLMSVTGNLVIYGDDEVNTCQGDSGGPELMDLGEGEVVVGITSFGPEGCKDFGAGTRVDVFAASFVDPWVAAKDAPGCAGGDTCVDGCLPHDPDCGLRENGERCLSAGECAGGICLPAPDEPAISYCTGTCGDCPAGMDCVPASGGVSVCAWPTPTPGAQASACERDTDCASNLCLPILGVKACTAFCDDGYPSCAAGLSCGLYGEDHVCVAAEVEDTGCTVAPAGRARRGGAGASLVLLVLGGYFFFASLARASLR